MLLFVDFLSVVATVESRNIVGCNHILSLGGMIYCYKFGINIAVLLFSLTRAWSYRFGFDVLT